MSRRKKIAIIAGAVVLVVAAAGAALYVFRPFDDGIWPFTDDVAEERGPGAAEALVEHSRAVLYQQGAELLRLDLESDVLEGVLRIGGFDTRAAPGSLWVAYNTMQGFISVDDRGRGDKPILRVLDPETLSDFAVGSGVFPAWNATGTHVAYQRPEDPADCEQGDCPEQDMAVHVFEVATRHDAEVLEAGRWDILGWLGAHVMIEDLDAGTIRLVARDGEAGTLDVPADAIAAVSPDGNWLLTHPASGRSAQIIPLDEELSPEEPREVVFPEGRTPTEFLDVAWSHDSVTVAVIVSGNDGNEIHLFDAEDPEARLHGGAEDAEGHLFWSPENDAFIFTRPDPEAEAEVERLELVRCVAETDECEALAPLEEPVTVLRYQ